jgi:hypothetical protein
MICWQNKAETKKLKPGWEKFAKPVSVLASTILWKRKWRKAK